MSVIKIEYTNISRVYTSPENLSTVFKIRLWCKEIAFKNMNLAKCLQSSTSFWRCRLYQIYRGFPSYISSSHKEWMQFLFPIIIIHVKNIWGSGVFILLFWKRLLIFRCRPYFIYTENHSKSPKHGEDSPTRFPYPFLPISINSNLISSPTKEDK